VIKEAYFSPDYLAREYRRLWPRVWQMACRTEELAAVGAYVTYDIGDQSVILVRSTASRIRAFHNACQHRGRRLCDGKGQMQHIRCRFHGWRWDLDGANQHVTFREDWCGQLDQMRYRWRKWLRMPANWKVALEAFNEGYHVSITHYPLNRFGTSKFVSRTCGPHSSFGSELSSLRAEGSTKHEASTSMDIRRSLADFYRYLKGAIDSNMTDTLVHAAQLLPSTVPEGASAAQTVAALMKMSIEIDAARGVKWPTITPEEYQRAGIDWHLFPNTILLPMATNCLGYRARPDGNDPDSCIFEVYQLERLPPDAVPEVKNLRNDDIHDEAFWGEILLQDFRQMEATHRGLKSNGYQGPRLNPRQESSIENFHRAYHEYLAS
jgi:nitrite reductase/ring-hydroxylating ferredoxin subunit